MKRFLTIFCAIAFSGAALSAQNNADITNKGIRTFANPAVGLDIARFSLKVGYEYQLGFWGHLDGEHMHNIKLGVAYTY